MFVDGGGGTRATYSKGGLENCIVALETKLSMSCSKVSARLAVPVFSHLGPTLMEENKAMQEPISLSSAVEKSLRFPN